MLTAILIFIAVYAAFVGLLLFLHGSSIVSRDE
jgi:hypothetical protein